MLLLLLLLLVLVVVLLRIIIIIIIGDNEILTKRFKETFGSHAKKIFNRFTTKESCTWNVTLKA